MYDTNGIDFIFSLERSLNVVYTDEDRRPYILSPAIYDFLLITFYGMFQTRPFSAKEISTLLTKKNSFFSSGAIEKDGSKYAQSRFLSGLVKKEGKEDSYNFVYSIQSSDYCKRVDISNDIPNSTGKELLYYLSGEGYLALKILIFLPWKYLQSTNIYFQEQLKNNKQISISRLQQRQNLLAQSNLLLKLNNIENSNSFILDNLRRETSKITEKREALFDQIYSKEFSEFRNNILCNSLNKQLNYQDDNNFKNFIGKEIANKYNTKVESENTTISPRNIINPKIIKRYNQLNDYFTNYTI